MGKAQKIAGYRAERGLVLEFEKEGLTAYRQPMSGQIKGYKGDVVLHYNGRKVLIEVKLRKGGFKRTWAMFGGKDNGTLRFKGPKGMFIITTDIHEIFKHEQVFTDVLDQDTYVITGYKQTMRYEKWLKECEILALKAPRKPYLFVKYYENT